MTAVSSGSCGGRFTHAHCTRKPKPCTLLSMRSSLVKAARIFANTSEHTLAERRGAEVSDGTRAKGDTAPDGVDDAVDGREKNEDSMERDVGGGGGALPAAVGDPGFPRVPGGVDGTGEAMDTRAGDDWGVVGARGDKLASRPPAAVANSASTVMFIRAERARLYSFRTACCTLEATGHHHTPPSRTGRASPPHVPAPWL